MKLNKKTKNNLIHLIVLLIILFLVAIILLNFLNKSKNENPDKYYLNEDVEFCNTIQFLCIENYTPFYDETGCGCEKT